MLRVAFITGLFATVLLSGCGRSSKPTSDLVAPKEYWDKTGDPNVDYWNLVQRECYEHKKQSPDSISEKQVCECHVTVIRGYPKSGVDLELVNWAEKLANWYDIKVDILKMKNDPDFYPRGIREKKAGKSPTIVEENEKLLVDWEVGFQTIRTEGIHLRDKLGSKYGKYFAPCVLDRAELICTDCRVAKSAEPPYGVPITHKKLK